MRHRIRYFGVVLLMLFAYCATAQERGVRLGSWTAYPVVGLTVGYDDNVALETEQELDSFFYRISPALRLEREGRRSYVRIQYAADIADYEVSDFDDYIDQELSAQWQYDPTVRLDVEVQASLARGHDRRGEGLREGLVNALSADVDEFDLFDLSAALGFGAPGARGRIEISLGHEDKSYRNNRLFTREGDYELDTLAGTFYWRLAPKTRALLRWIRREIDYDFADRDGEEDAYYAGITWDATGKLEGRMLYGAIEREFDTLMRSGYSGSSWEVGLTWTPRSYTVIDLSSSRLTDEAFGASDLLLRDENALSWRQQWRPRFFTVLDLTRIEEDFRPGPRDDEVDAWGLSAGYQLRRWMSLGLGWQSFRRRSSLAAFNYDRDEILLSVELSL